ncbi:hypothetical protein A2U01_0093849, partial [Trifolium medium]|nr:hypothetical protein [Trifolium medium]
RLATARDQATESLPSTGDNWRELATLSPPPRLATNWRPQERRQAPTGERHAEQSKAECSVAAKAPNHPKIHSYML